MADGTDVEASGADSPDALVLDARCVSLARRLARRDLHIGGLGLDLAYHGFPSSERKYAEQLLGMSVSAFQAKQRFARRLGRFPDLRHALEDGEICMEAAALLVRVVTQESVQASVDRARARTVKHLAEDVRLPRIAPSVHEATAQRTQSAKLAESADADEVRMGSVRRTRTGVPRDRIELPTRGFSIHDRDRREARKNKWLRLLR